ncbi:receptor-like protein 15 [Manihot esculenta]|uniref:receptor-like protein 15 n=1 Tax=Manihot esculenta TaxID=3983 RepID=UPI001CC55392|nr:receptor-like protein 15 [Manihot esculenta]
MELANLAKWLLLGLFILCVQIHGNNGCFEVERLGLLDLKASIGSDGFDADHPFSSWVDDSLSDCCKWERVTCNFTTGHVIDLSLNNLRQYEENIWFLNLSMFESFKELRSLNLSHNRFGGLIDEKGFDGLKKLEILDLSDNYFNNSNFSSLAALPSLTTLILSRNNMKGSFPSKEFKFCTVA